MKLMIEQRIPVPCVIDSTSLKPGSVGLLILLLTASFFTVQGSSAAKCVQVRAQYTSHVPFEQSLRSASDAGRPPRGLCSAESPQSTQGDAESPGAEGMIEQASEPPVKPDYSKDRTGGDMGSNPLKPCPNSPNCVCTLSDTDRHRMQPIPYTGSRERAKWRLIVTLKGMKSAKVLTERDDYVHATFTSNFLRFVDDVEFWLDDSAKVIHFRSASRTGYYDFGVNRRRMEAFRTRFLETRDSK
jgi:uncharacterized protein (DUF1499 family)